MARKDRKSDAPAGATIPTSGETARMAEEHVKKMSEMQKEIVDAFTQINLRWLSRASAQATLASELGTKLAAARALPDVAAIYQDWMAQQTKMIAEESERVLTDSRKAIEAISRLFERTRGS
jgi:hypothetical protein